MDVCVCDGFWEVVDEVSEFCLGSDVVEGYVGVGGFVDFLYVVLVVEFLVDVFQVCWVCGEDDEDPGEWLVSEFVVVYFDGEFFYDAVFDEGVDS